ncbi:MAG: hypothetical protein AAGC55_22635, partial [Myxococcota bacterium]
AGALLRLLETLPTRAGWTAADARTWWQAFADQPEPTDSPTADRVSSAFSSTIAIDLRGRLAAEKS